MSSIRTTARQAGLIYFVFSLVAIVGEFVIPRLVVPGDAAATAQNIRAATGLWRLSILTGMVTHLLFIVLVTWLYRLFEAVDRRLALLMMLFVLVGIATAFANELLRFVPLVFLGGADFLSAFPAPQLDALTLGMLRVHTAGVAVTSIFWGLWLFPFGALVIKSGWFPRVLGWLLLVAGIAYVAGSVTAIALPDHRAAVNRVVMPLYFGEVPIIFWLLIVGAREPAGHPPRTETSTT